MKRDVDLVLLFHALLPLASFSFRSLNRPHLDDAPKKVPLDYRVLRGGSSIRNGLVLSRLVRPGLLCEEKRVAERVARLEASLAGAGFARGEGELEFLVEDLADGEAGWGRGGEEEGGSGFEG